MYVCPKIITIRRTREIGEKTGTDRLCINPTDDCIASVKNIVINIDDPISVMFLAFHVKNNVYCEEYKIPEAKKKFCDNKWINYVHFYFSLEGCSPNDYEYLVAFLPRIINCSELQKLANEFCNVTEWLELKQVNCLVFRYGAPVHGMDDSRHWQKQLEKCIKEAKELSAIYKMEGRIKHIPTLLVDKNLTISKNAPLDNINVS